MSDERPSAAAGRRFLRIYLNDHLMWSAGAIRLARRCRSSNRGTPLDAFLEELETELIEDRAHLEQIMAALGFRADPFKLAAAAVGERLGRAKLNGRLLGYSDLSRVLELEGLYAGGDLRLRLWRSLRQVSGPRIAGVDIDRLIQRASAQLGRIEAHQLEAAERAFPAMGPVPRRS